MIPAAALLLAAATTLPCNLEALVRRVDLSPLPARSARLVTAKIRYAESMRKAGSIAPTTPQDELRIARAMAERNAVVVHAIDDSIRCIDQDRSLPARLTIHILGSQGGALTIDGVVLHNPPFRATLRLGAGTHEISFDGIVAATTATVTLAEGEPRSLGLEPKPALRDEKPRYFIVGHVETIVTEARLPQLSFTVHRGADGQPVAVKTLDRVTIEKRGSFDATDLFALDGGGNVRVSDAAGLREIVRESGPFAVRVAGQTAAGDRFDLAAHLKYGREIVVRGTVPDYVRLVQRNGHRPVGVTEGRFELTVPEGPDELVAYRDIKERETILFHRIDFHCDAEVRLTKEKLEVVQGGCPGTPPAWREAHVDELEPVQHIAFNFTNGAIKPASRWLTEARASESESEETVARMAGEGLLQVHAFSESGVVVHRTFVRLELVGGGCIVPSSDFGLDLPRGARYVEIKGWTPATSGRYDLETIRSPRY